MSATTYWNKVVCTDGSDIQNIDYNNISNPPTPTTIQGTANEIEVTTVGSTATIGLTDPVIIGNLKTTNAITYLNSQNVQSVSGTDYNTYAVDQTDPGDIQYFTRLSTFRSTVNISAPSTIPLWSFIPVDGHSYDVDIRSTVSADSSSTIHRTFLIRGSGTVINGATDIVGPIPARLTSISATGFSPVVFSLTFLGTLIAPINITTRIEVVRTFA